jgi:hypothetical protein
MTEDLDTTRTPANFCLKCGYLIDAASSIRQPDAKPKAGDVSMCINCGALSRFRVDLTLEPLGQQGLEGLDAQAKRIISVGQAYIWARGPIHKRETKQ